MRRAWLLVALLSGVPLIAARAQQPPAAPVRPVVDTLHGITVEDPYRWMEEPQNAEFADWISAQGAFARAWLDVIPGRGDLLERVRELMGETAEVSRLKRAVGYLFYLRSDPGVPLPKLVVRGPDGAERVLVDPAAAAATDGESHTSIDNFAPSPDGRLVAVSLARGGAEISRVHVVETASGAMRSDVIERIWGEFPVSWLPDGSGFFYTQMAPEGFEDPTVDRMLGMRARFHRLGTPPEDDPVLLGPGVSPSLPIDAQENPWIGVPEASDWVLAHVTSTREEMRLCVARLAELRGAETPWRCIAEYEDLIEHGWRFERAVHGSDLFLLSSKEAPNRRVLRVRLDAPDLEASEVVVPEREEQVLTDLVAGRDALYVKTMDRGSDRIWRLPFDGGDLEEVPLPSSQQSVELVASPDQDDLVFSTESWTQPSAWFVFDPATGRSRDLGLRTGSPADFSGIVVESVDAESFDGALVPLTILRSKNLALDSSHLAHLYGYAGYGIPLRPEFRPSDLAWLERGGVVAICHARGGGERGRAWYLAGRGPNKQNGVRDYIACAEYLSAHGYTRPSGLGAWGASMGGVLVGGAITERPDAFGAAVIEAGVLNTARFLEGVGGPTQMAELGDPRTEEGYRSLLEMDPYHAVRDGARYPAVLLSVGLNDNRVSSWHSGKFAARLQAASGSEEPVLVRIEEDAGHGSIGSTREQAARKEADIFSFLLWQLGDLAFQPRE